MATAEDQKIIEKLKKMLISRDTTLQMSSVDFIRNNLKEVSANSASYDALVEFLIVSDICIYLGEASATLHSKLLTTIVQCLKMLSKTQTFYKHSYAPCVTASLVRATHLYIKEDGKENIVIFIIHFLSDIFAQVIKFNLTPVISIESSYDAMQILNLLQTVVDKENILPDTLLVACKALHLMITIKEDSIKLNIKTIDNVTLVLKKYLSSLCAMLVQENSKLNTNDYFSCTFGMICHLGNDVLKICNLIKVCLSNNRLKQNQMQTLNQNIENLIKSAHESMIFIVAKIKSYEEYLDFSCYETFLKFLNTFFHHEFLKISIPEFAKMLLNNGFLMFLPMLRAESKNQSFRKLCQMNLAELLFILSLENFNFSLWNGGENSFKKHLYEGLLENENDLIDWPRILFDNEASETVLNSMMIFLYFYCISPSSSQREERMFLPHIVYYILNTPKNTSCPLPIVKCLWLIFAITSSSGADLSQISGGKLTVEKANYKLSKIISLNIKEVYTHHPSIVYWAFSSARIPFSTQNVVLQLWLEKEKELPSNLLSLSAVWWSLLDIIQNGYENVTETASEILKHCISNVCDETSANKIKNSLWKSLPDLLTYYIEDEIKNESTLKYMLELCSSQIPSNPNLDDAFKSAFLLIEVISMFDKSNDSLFYNFLTEAYCLLNVTLKQQNTIVLSRFTSTESFINYVYSATSSSNDNLSILAYKIFSLSAYYLINYNINSEKTFTFQPHYLLQILKMEKNEEKCLSIMQLIHTFFNISYDRPEITPLFDIKTNYSYENTLISYKSLYFRLQMVCCKESKAQYESGWQCLNSILLFAAVDENDTFLKIVANQPWTHTLIRYYFSQNDTPNTHFLKFIFNWLTCLRLFVKNKKQKFDAADKHNFLFKSISLIMYHLNEKMCISLSSSKKEIANKIINTINTF